MGRTIIYFLLIIGLSSCYSVKTTQIDVLKSAKATLPTNINSITVLNASQFDNKYKFTNIQQQLYNNFVSILSKQLVTDVSGFLSQSPRLKKVSEHNKPYLKKAETLSKPINWEHIEQICYETGSNALLALEAIKVTDTIIRLSYFEDANFYSSVSVLLVTNSFWRLYNLNNKQIQSQKVFTDTSYFYNYENLNLFWNDLKNTNVMTETISDMALPISQQISEYIAPYWISENRFLIDIEHPYMNLAMQYAKIDNWKDAAKIWKKLTTDKNEKLRAGACFNMAVASEILQTPDLALVWLNKSKKYFEFYITNDYQYILNSRIKEEEKLNKQFKN